MHESVLFLQKEDDDGDGNSSFTCFRKCIDIGRSGTFETYDKSDTDVIGGVFGVPVSVFYFGETQECRIEVASGGVSPSTLGTGNVAGTSTSSTASSSPVLDTTSQTLNEPTEASTETSSNASPVTGEEPKVQVSSADDEDSLGTTPTEISDEPEVLSAESSAGNMALVSAYAILSLILLPRFSF